MNSSSTSKSENAAPFPAGDVVSSSTGSPSPTPSVTSSASFHLPVPVMVTVIAWLVVGIALAVVFLTTMPLVRSEINKVAGTFADEIAVEMAAFSSRRLTLMEQASRMAQRSTETVDFFSDSTPIAQRIALAVKWFGSVVDALQVHFVFVDASDVGFLLGPYSVFDPLAFPRQAGRIVVQLVNPSNVTLAAYAPIDGNVGNSTPFLLTNGTGNNVFNFSNRPYAPTFKSKFSWGAPYVGVYSHTSSLPVGGPVITHGSYGGSYSLHDYAIDQTIYFEGGRMTPNSKLALVDFTTHVYLGGNTAASSTIQTYPGVFRLATLSDISDPLVSMLMKSAPTPTILNCSGHCSYIMSHGKLQESWTFNGLSMDPYYFVRVVKISGQGLELRLLLVVPSSDFDGGVLSSIVSGVIGSTVGVSALALLVGGAVWLLFAPLRTVTRELQLLSSTIQSWGGQQSQKAEAELAKMKKLAGKRKKALYSGAVASDSPIDASQGCLHPFQRFHIAVREVDVIQSAVERLVSEVYVIRSFMPQLPPPALTIASTSFSGSFSALGTGPASPRDTASATASFSLPQQNCTPRPTTTSPPMQHLGPTNSDGAPEGDFHRDILSSGASERLELESGGSGKNAHIDDNDGKPEAESHAIVQSAPYTVGTLWVLPVTFIVGDIQRFHEYKDQLLPTTLLDFHSRYLKCVQVASAQAGAVLSSFYGDRVMLHLNAERRIRHHATAAAELMLQVQLAVKEELHCTVRMAAATSSALCGVMGPPTVRSFHVVGNCVLHAFTLCAHSRAVRRTLLLSRRTSELITQRRSVVPVHVGLVVLPYENEPCVLSVPVAAHDVIHFPFAYLRNQSATPSSKSSATQPLSPSHPRSFHAAPTLISAQAAFAGNNTGFEAAARGDTSLSHKILRESCWKPKDQNVKGREETNEAPSPSAHSCCRCFGDEVHGHRSLAPPLAAAKGAPSIAPEGPLCITCARDIARRLLCQI